MATSLPMVISRNAGQPALAAWCGLPDPSVSALLAREDFDAVVLDMQHSAVDFAAAARAIPLIAAAGKPAMVRIPVGDFATASRLLDAGASGIIAPMVNSVADAIAFAQFTKYPPLGERSWGPHGALAAMGLAADAYFRSANDITVALAMIETREALAVIDDILAVPGIDGVFIGPTDLSIGLSGGLSMDPTSAAVESALDHAAARAKAAGKVAGIFAASGARAAQLHGRGFHLISVGSDAILLKAGAQAALQSARSRV
ncbi:HpcH/HpaI aldolase family protein [Microvirga antarctica]|uniref:HpcH/HpaI aldolase family protein n=1 Tax=Microvirga antarctica TaxID=2819233 RepID=UPI001B312457|nr:aldolase/citrate lyase family protein [Microvirga antarctica]